MMFGTTMGNGLRATPLEKGRLRAAVSFSLSVVALARIRFLAKQQGVSASRIVEKLVGDVDYREIFACFARRAPLAEIVITTGHPPAVVAALYEEFQRDLYGTARPQLPPVVVQPLPKQVPRQLGRGR